jgi:hypothetical protein
MKLTFIGHRINKEQEGIVRTVLRTKKENTGKVSE